MGHGPLDSLHSPASASFRRQLSGAGTHNGYAAGQRADLGGTRLAGANRPARRIGG